MSRVAKIMTFEVGMVSLLLGASLIVFGDAQTAAALFLASCDVLPLTMFPIVADL